MADLCMQTVISSRFDRNGDKDMICRGCLADNGVLTKRGRLFGDGYSLACRLPEQMLVQRLPEEFDEVRLTSTMHG
jgi:hypothetical protein